MWTAAVVATATGAAVTSADKSCILPIPASRPAGQPFVNFAYSGDGADSSLDRTREGYVEIIEMATYRDTSTTALIVTHKSNGVPGQGNFTCARPAIDGDRFAWTPTEGGLFGGLTLINVFDGSAYSQDATALDHVFEQRPCL